MPVVLSNGAVAAIATATVVVAADLTGWSAGEPDWAPILAAAVGAVAGTVIQPMATGRPINSPRSILGYVMGGWVLVYITHDLTPPQFAAITQIPNAEEFWSHSVALRNTVMAYALTQAKSLTSVLRRRKPPTKPQ